MNTLSSVENTDSSDSEDEIRNECVICGVDMGRRNPRQLCCKTYCPKEFEIKNEDKTKTKNK